MAEPSASRSIRSNVPVRRWAPAPHGYTVLASTAAGGALLLALGAGLGMTLVSGLLGSLGQGGRLPAAVAAGLPLLLFGALGLAWLYRYDRL